MADVSWWMLTLLVLIDFGLPFGLLTLGGWLIRRTLKNRHKTDVRACAKCRYDMRATQGLTCPECGRSHQSIEQLYPTLKRVRTKVALGLLLCIPGLCLAAFSLWYFPKTWMKNRETQAKIDSLQRFGAEFSGYGNHEWVSPPIWMRYLAHWMELPLEQYAKIYGNDILKDELNLPPRMCAEDQLGATLADTTSNWLWYPSRNYRWYLMEGKYSGMDFSKGSGTLTADDAQDIVWLHPYGYVHIGPKIRLDDQALTAFEKLTDEVRYGNLDIDNFVPDPKQAHLWKSVRPIDALRSITIDARQGINKDLFKSLQACPKCDSLTIIAGPQSEHHELVAGCLGFGNMDKIALTGVRVSPAQFQLLSKNKYLRHLSLDLPQEDAPGYEDRDLLWLSSFERLDSLRLANMPKVTGKFVVRLPDKFFESLTVENTGFDDQALALLATKPSLRGVHLKESKVTLSGFKDFLRKVPSLSFLSYDQTVDLEACDLMANVKNLNYVTLTGLDDVCLKAFKEPNKVGHVTVFKHRLSEKMERDIKAGKFHYDYGGFRQGNVYLKEAHETWDEFPH